MLIVLTTNNTHTHTHTHENTRTSSEMKNMFSTLLVTASQVYASIQIYQDTDSKCVGALVCQSHLSKLKSTQKVK